MRDELDVDVGDKVRRFIFFFLHIEPRKNLKWQPLFRQRVANFFERFVQSSIVRTLTFPEEPLSYPEY